MARYRKIDPRIWNDQKFRGLLDDEKLVFLFMLTHPKMTSLGAMSASAVSLAEDIRWKLPRFEEALAKLQELKMVRFDRDARLIWLPNFLRYNGPESPNVAAAWREQLDELPECGMIAEIAASVEAELAQVGGSFVDAWTHGKRRHSGKPNLDVTQIVRRRDGDFCRYCWCRVNWKDRKGEKGGTYDHVDPRGTSTDANIVVCCRSCNSKKGLRNPEQAGMKLRPPKKVSRSNPDSASDPYPDADLAAPDNQEQEQEQEQEPDLEQKQNKNPAPNGKGREGISEPAARGLGIIDSEPEPPNLDPEAYLVWTSGVEFLGESKRSLLGNLVKQYGQHEVAGKLAELMAMTEPPRDPAGYLVAAMRKTERGLVV